jgi:GMP synthase (glutamine-hydrolysing)
MNIQTMAPLKILYLIHADFRIPGIVEKWAKQHKYQFQIVRPYQGDSLPSIADFDMLILMGGPQSPLKLDQFPYLADEINLIKKAIAAKKKVLGFCLGAQLVGEALGAKTERSPEKEVGVYPVTLTEDALTDPLLEGFNREVPMLHWHNDMPGLTTESVLLGYTAGCPRQLIRYLPGVYGFQPHLEITRNNMKIMIAFASADLKPSRYTQTADELRKQDYERINAMMIKILDRLVALDIHTANSEEQ